MAWSSEGLLQLLVTALYLQDSMLALRHDEAALERGLRGRWSARFGARLWRIGGRELFAPNPFAPHRALFRLTWRMEGPARPQRTARALVVPRELAWFIPFVAMVAVSLFVLLPVGLFSQAGRNWVFAAVALLYVSNLTALSLAWRWRKRLGIARKEMVALSLECLACAPYSLNLVRRLCAAMKPQEDFCHAAARLLDAVALADAHVQCLARVDEQIEMEFEGSRRFELLRQSRERFLSPTSASEPS